MGEVRDSQAYQNDVWAKSHFGSFDHKQNLQVNGFSMDYQDIQAGVDKAVMSTDNAIFIWRWRVSRMPKQMTQKKGTALQKITMPVYMEFM